MATRESLMVISNQAKFTVTSVAVNFYYAALLFDSSIVHVHKQLY
jgi:hypothetical protein